MKRKSMNLMRSVVCIMLLFAVFAAGAQNKVSLSLQDAQEYALEHNRTLENASLEIKKAEAVRWQTIASMLPQVSAGLDYTNMMGYKMDFGRMVIAMPPSASFTITTAVALSGAIVPPRLPIFQSAWRISLIAKADRRSRTSEGTLLLGTCDRGDWNCSENLRA